MAEPGVLGVVASAADGLEALGTGLVEPAVRLGWQVAVTLTPTAARWLRAIGETERLERVTGLPVREAPRLPAEPRPHPDPDCCLVAPASANFVAKLATGICDNQALTQVVEAVGTVGLPVVVFPRVNAAHARHPAWERHLDTLRSANVELLYGQDIWPLREPREGAGEQETPWDLILAAVDRARRGTGGSVRR